jgi:predicted dehydrogenase
MAKILVVGCGSIGSRHVRNLVQSCGAEVLVCETDAVTRRRMADGFGVRALARLDEALDAGPDGVVLATPSSLHYEQAVAAIERGIPLLVEKPMTETLEQARRVETLSAARRVPVLNGFNMRFHPSIRRVKTMLDDGLIGRAYSMRALSGFYLPYWHPETDYRASYSARKDLGGGVLMDNLHELDFIRWFFGEAEQLYALGGRVSGLEIETEDLVELLIRFASGPSAAVNLNYLNRTRLREFVIIGETGLLAWNSNKRAVEHFDPKDGCWKVYGEAFEFQINDTYVDEVKHFLRVAAGEVPSINDAHEGRAVMELVEAARESMRTGRPVRIGQGGGA